MNDDLKRKANEAFQAKIRELQGRPKKDDDKTNADRKAQGLLAVEPQELLGIDLSGNFCAMAPKAINVAQKEIHLFAWLIPDQYETIILAMLAGFEAILPDLCGTAAGAETKQKAG